MNTQAIIDSLPEINGDQHFPKNQPKVAGALQKFLPLGNTVTQKTFSQEYDRILPVGISQKLASWLRKSDWVTGVSYSGLNQVTNTLRFSVSNSSFGFNLLRAFFSSGRFTGLTVEADNQQREFRIEIRSTDHDAILEYFKRLLGHLDDEFRYRKFLSRQIKIEERISKIFGLHISDSK